VIEDQNGSPHTKSNNLTQKRLPSASSVDQGERSKGMTNQLTQDHFPFANNCRSTDGPKCAEELTDLMRKLKKGLDLRSPLANRDAIVIAESAFEELRSRVSDATDKIAGIDTGNPDSLCGIPVFHCPTDDECIAMAQDLAAKGKKVAIVLSPGAEYFR
jgi:hypothetical protein